MKNDRFKFRVWDIGAKKYYQDEDVLLKPNGECLIKTFHANTDHEKGYFFEQCTGLKDKNGKLIFEGDVVNDGETSFTVDLQTFYAGIELGLELKQVEIISNIHSEE